MIFLVVVEAAAVNGPEFPAHARVFIFFARGRTQGQVQPDEINRRANPHDAGHHVKPAQGEANPGGEV